LAGSPLLPMDTWSPLFSSIVLSSVWGLAPHVRIVWITMLAIKDKDGLVMASIPGLARAAVVSDSECRDALKTLLAPDPDSRCSQHEGRRISAVDGGWHVLGHARFQEKMQKVTKQIGNARRQAHHRDKAKPAKNGQPLTGELEYLKKESAGASVGELDQVVSDNLPGREMARTISNASVTLE